MFLETAFIFPFSTWWAVPFCENDNLNLVVVIEIQEYIQYFCTVCHLVFFPCYLLNCIFFFFPMTMWNAYSFKQCYEILRTDNSNLIAFTHLPSSKNARENSMQSPFSENYTIYFLLKYYFFRRYFRIVWISCLQGNLRHSECKDS